MIQDNSRRKKATPMAAAVIEEYNAAKKRLEENTLTTKQVAERFGVTRQAVDLWVKTGSIKAYEGPPGIGRVFDRADVDAFQPVPRGYRSHLKNRDN